MVVNGTAPSGSKGYDPNLAGKNVNSALTGEGNLGQATVGLAAGIGGLSQNPLTGIQDNALLKSLRYAFDPQHNVDAIINEFKPKDDSAPSASSVR